MQSDASTYATVSTQEQFLLDRINYERSLSMPCSEEAFKLDRMRGLLERLGNPQLDLPIVHIAGTKGKGSTAAMMASVLQAAGYRTGLFTSPHLDRVEERIVVDGRICPPEAFAALIDLIRPAVEALDGEAASIDPPELGPTYFEILTAAALCHFVRCGVTAVVLEVGLGGRLDSTNVCTPQVSILTSISFDHTKQLGATLAAIAAEKAGIIKPGVPVVSGVTADEARMVVRNVAIRNGCRLLELGVDFDVDYHPPTHLELAASPARFDFRVFPRVQAEEGPEETAVTQNATQSPFPSDRTDNDTDNSRGLLALGCLDMKMAGLSDVAIGLLGRHQAANAALVVAAVDALRRAGWTIPETALRNGLANVVWPARIEVIGRRPTIVLDAAHNAASVAALVEVLAESLSARRRLLVFATTREKDLRGMLEPLSGHFDHVIFTRYQNNPRGVPPEELLALATEISPIPQAAEGPNAISPLPQAGEGPGVRADGTGEDSANDRPTTSPHPLPEQEGTVVTIAPTPVDAWAAIHRLATPDDLVCVTGSFFIAAEMQREIVARPMRAVIQE